MKKKKFLSVLASTAMVTSIMTSTPMSVIAANSNEPQFLEGENHKKVVKGSIVYDGEFFANGTPITIEAPKTKGKTALIKWDNGSYEIDGDDAVYGGSDSTSSDIELESTSITMNGGTVKLLIAGNKMTNETKSKNSTINTATVDINGGTISQGLSGIDNQNTAYGESVIKKELYKNYAINTLNITIDGANVSDFRGVTSYTYTNNMNITVGKDAPAQLGNMIWGTNGIIDNATFTMYSGKTNVASSIYRSQIRNKMTYNILGGEVGDIYAGSYYPIEESAAGTNNWNGWNAGHVDYGFANEIEVNIGEGVVYTDIISGFQSRKDEIEAFKTKFPNDSWRITALNDDIPITLNLGSKQKNTTLDKYSVIDAKDTSMTTNWLVTGVTLNKKEATLNVKDTTTLLATITPTNATNKNVNWTSSDVKVATVDATGKVTAVSAGTTIITAKAGDKKATCTVTVKNPVKVDFPTIDTDKPVDIVEVGVQDKESQTTVKDSVTSIVDEIKSGKDVPTETMSKETADKVKKAVDAGKDITTKVEAKTLDEKDIDKEVVKKVGALLAEVDQTNGNESTVALYLDLGVMLLADNTELGTLNKLDKPIEFTVALPKNLQKEGRKYYVVRIHDGVAKKLEVTINKDGTFTFKTDAFSTYALIYEDVKVETPSDEKPSEITPEQKPEVKPETKPSKTPNTGDSNRTLIMSSILVAGSLFVAIIVLNKKRKYNK